MTYFNQLSSNDKNSSQVTNNYIYKDYMTIYILKSLPLWTNFLPESMVLEFSIIWRKIQSWATDFGLDLCIGVHVWNGLNMYNVKYMYHNYQVYWCGIMRSYSDKDSCTCLYHYHSTVIMFFYGNLSMAIINPLHFEMFSGKVNYIVICKIWSWLQCI